MFSIQVCLIPVLHVQGFVEVGLAKLRTGELILELLAPILVGKCLPRPSIVQVPQAHVLANVASLLLLELSQFPLTVLDVVSDS